MFNCFRKKSPEDKVKNEKDYKTEKQRQDKVLENAVDWGDRFNRARYMDKDGQ